MKMIKIIDITKLRIDIHIMFNQHRFRLWEDLNNEKKEISIMGLVTP